MKIDPGDLIVGGIALLVVMLVMLSTISIVVDQVQTQAAAAVNWTFTGHEGAEAILGFIPFGWIAGIAVFGIVGAFMLAMGLKNKE